MSLVNTEILNRVCQAKPKHIGANMQVLRKDNRVAYFKDNHSKILAVAHLDHVNPTGFQWSGRIELDRAMYFSPYLDDRLGVYTILHVLPALGVNVDILFTMDEENGTSTADLFSTTFKYNWLVEFDRRGEDVVTYRYQDKEWEDKLKSVGFKVGAGTYTDICKLQDLGCKAFNVGVGYENEHNIHSFFVEEVYERQMARFVKFHDKYKETRFPHIKSVIPAWNYQAPYYGNNNSYWGGEVNYNSAGFGVSSEYEKWARSRESRKNSKQFSQTLTVANLLPLSQGIEPSPPVWCPHCQAKLKVRECPTCGVLKWYENEWWPAQIIDDDMAAVESTIKARCAPF